MRRRINKSWRPVVATKWSALSECGRSSPHGPRRPCAIVDRTLRVRTTFRVREEPAVAPRLARAISLRPRSDKQTRTLRLKKSNPGRPKERAGAADLDFQLTQENHFWHCLRRRGNASIPKNPERAKDAKPKRPPPQYDGQPQPITVPGKERTASSSPPAQQRQQAQAAEQRGGSLRHYHRIRGTPATRARPAPEIDRSAETATDKTVIQQGEITR